MTELISLSQANHLMLLILIAAPIVGAAWGLLTKQLSRGLIIGAVIGVGNFAMWTIYNAITNQLGLDTVKNLLVNLGLFIFVGIVAGLVIGRLNRRTVSEKSTESVD